MLKRLAAAWDVVRTGLWLVPSLMIVAGIGLAAALLSVDAGRGAEDRMAAWWLNSGSAEDARNLLSTLLTAIISMASMVFSVTVVALTLAANQYGSRLIRIFRADLRTQITLGTFAMTIVYCLIVLRSIHGSAAAPYVPHVSVTVGTALALACVLALLAFIQGVARSIVADHVVNRVGRELDRAITALPAATESNGGEHGLGLPTDFEEKASVLALEQEGYVQAIDYDEIAAWAEQRDAFVRLDILVGDFVTRRDRRIRVYVRSGESVGGERINNAVVVGAERTPTQDLEFGIRHLVEVALRALSPGINDPFTAVVVIDRLRASLTRVMGRALPSAILRDRSGQARIVRQVTTYDGILDAAFHQIRQAGSGKPAILIHLLKAITRIADAARLDEQRGALARHARLIRAAGLRDIPDPADQADVERSFRRAVGACGELDNTEPGSRALSRASMAPLRKKRADRSRDPFGPGRSTVGEDA